jgi:hypothetical protein
MASIELTREIVKPSEDPVLKHVWKVRITAKGTGIESEVFVYHAAMDDDPIQGDIFEAVASVPQMNELPIDNPATIEGGQVIPYYRKDVLEYDARSPDQAEYIWDSVQKDIGDLVENFNSAQNLTGVEVVNITGRSAQSFFE